MLHIDLYFNVRWLAWVLELVSGNRTGNNERSGDECLALHSSNVDRLARLRQHADLMLIHKGSPLEGADGNIGGVDLQRACPVGRPGTVGRAILPQGHVRAERSEAFITWAWPGWVSPLGDSLFGWGRLGRGVPRGETKAGEARHAPCSTPHLTVGGGD